MTRPSQAVRPNTCRSALFLLPRSGTPPASCNDKGQRQSPDDNAVASRDGVFAFAKARIRRIEGERECSQVSRSSPSPPPRSSRCWSGSSDPTGVVIEAGQLRADIHHAANRALGGESLLAIRVDHPTPWRRGHVHLSAPLGYEWLVGDVSPAVLSRLPDRYDMVIHCGGAA